MRSFYTAFLSLILIATGGTAIAGTVTATVTGNWNAAATWSYTAINKTGTITSATNSTIVTGSGTSFLTELSVGSVIQRQTGTAIGTVASIQSNTQLTLVANAATTNTNGTYRLSDGPGGPVDLVIINTGINVTVTANAACASLTIQTGSSSNTVTINSGITLDVTGAVTIDVATLNNRNKIIAVSGTLNAASLSILASAGDSRDGILSIATTGIVTLTGNISMAGSFARSHIDMAGNAILNVGGNINNGAGASGGGFTAPPSTSTINLNGTAAQTVFLAGGGASLGLLKINNAAGVTLGAAVTVADLTIGDVTANSVFADGGFQLSSTGTLTLASGRFELGATSATTYPAFTTHTISAGTTVEYAAAAAQTVSTAPSYHHLSFTGAGTKTVAAGTLSVAGNWDLSSTATLATNNPTVNITGDITGNGALTATSGVITILGNWNHSGTFTHNGGTVHYQGASAQAVKGAAYSTLQINNSATATLAAAGSAVTLTIGDATANTVFSDGGFQLTSTGTLNLTSGIFRLGGTAATTFPAFSTTNIASGTTVEYVANAGQAVATTPSYHHLLFSGTGTKTVASGTLSIAGNWTVNSTTALNTNNPTVNLAGNLLGSGNITSTSNTLTVSGDWTNSGTFTPNGGTVAYDGGAGQVVAALNYHHLMFSGAGTKTPASGNLAVAGNWSVGSTTALNTNNPTVTVTGNISGNGNITSTSGVLSIGGSWQHSGSFTHNSGTVNYSNAAGGQTIAALSYHSLTLSNTSGTNTVTGNLSVPGTFTTTAGGILDMGTNTLSVVTVSNAGLIRTQNTSATPITPGKTWGGTVEYNNATGGQTVVAGPYTNLTMGNTSGSNTAAAALAVNGVLTLSGGILDMAASALSGTTFTATGTGTIKTQNSTATPLPVNITWEPAIEYNRTGNQSVVAGIYSTLITSGSGTKTMTGSSSVTAALTLTAATLSISTHTLTIKTTAVTNGTGSVNAGSGTVVFDVAGTVALPNSFFSVTPVNNITVTGGATVNLPGTPTQQTIQGTLNLTNGKFGLGDNATLVLSGTVLNMSASNCIIGRPTGSIQIIGAGATGTLYFDQSVPNSSNLVNNFIVGKINISGTVTIGNTFKVRGILTPTAGTVNSNGNLAIASDATGSGRIYPDINPANFQFVGGISIERFVKSKNLRKFLFLSSPVDGVTVRNAWQDDIFITGPGTGGTPCGATTGNGGATDKYNLNGFDATTANTVSIYTYDQNVAARWVAVPNTSTTLAKGKGYRVLFRGERGVNDANCADYLMLNGPPAPTSATMNVSGTPTTGDVFVAIDGPTTGAFGYTLLGNPYPCELDFTLFRSQNNNKIAATYWTYDPNGTTSATSYLTVNNGTVVGGYHSGASPNDYPNPNIIASGQAFFVQADSDTTLRFSETQKVNQNQPGVFRTANTWNSRIRVHFKQADDSFIDNVVVRFSADPTVTTAESTEWDAITFNGGTYLATIKGNRSFAIQTRPLNFFNDTVMVRIVSATTGNFKLSFSDFENFTQAAEIILLDLFTGTQTNVKANPVYPFTITSSSASQGGRFKLVFRSAASVLPVTFLDISAIARSQGVQVNWKLSFEQGISKYVVERSRNGRDFSFAGEVASRGNSNTTVEYSFTDLAPLPGNSYYRVKTVETGEGVYSEIVKVNSSKQQALLSLHPNPAKDKLRLTMYDDGNFNRTTVVISNAQGKTIMQLNNISTNGYVIDVSGLPNGMYFISLTGAGGERMMDRFIKY